MHEYPSPAFRGPGLACVLFIFCDNLALQCETSGDRVTLSRVSGVKRYSGDAVWVFSESTANKSNNSCEIECIKNSNWLSFEIGETALCAIQTTIKNQDENYETIFTVYCQYLIIVIRIIS